MSCDDVRPRLSGYLDGDLDPERGSVVRGHLRTCEACRQIATDEAALRDRLRELAPVDPPASMWAGIQARLAKEEVAHSQRPAWRRALARWAPAAPRFAAGGLLAAAAVALLVWRAQGGPDAAKPVMPDQAPIAASSPTKVTGPTQVVVGADSSTDVTADLATEAARVTATYADAAEELLELAGEARGRWTTEQKDAFDAHVVDLRASITAAAEGRPRQRAWRELIRYLQGAVVRDDITLAGVSQ
ncbi:MAG: zf-HC2 domain-containing protein [Deltaproteobacteria bacterium]|nr:zf-HC2 domain-containing protein [Deltaproteobacteria bacterium]